MEDLSIDDISDMVIDVILSENILDKETLGKRIKPILKVWMKKCKSPKTQIAFESQLNNIIKKNKESRISIRNRYIKIIDKSNFERNFYRNELQTLLGDGIHVVDSKLKIGKL